MKWIHSKPQAPEDGCTNIRNMLSSKWWNNKASDIKLVYLYSNYQDDARSNKLKKKTYIYITLKTKILSILQQRMGGKV